LNLTKMIIELRLNLNTYFQENFALEKSSSG